MLLQTTGLSKYIGETAILRNISLQIQERDRIGLVGVNGAGKSTLLQILAGESGYDDGEIFRSKDLTIGYLAQNSGLESEGTIGDEMRKVFANLIDMENELRELEARISTASHAASGSESYEQLLARYARLSDRFRERGGYEMEAQIRGVLHGMGFGDFPRDTPIRTLSGGQKTRLAMAKLLLSRPDLLLLDEPTNHLDIPTLTWLESYLQSYEGALLVVSHDRYFLDSIVTALYEIERQVSKRYTGNYSKYIERKAADAAIALKHYEKQQEEISRLEDFIQRNLARASTTKRAQSRRRKLERMERLDRPAGELKHASFTFEINRVTGQDVLDVQDLSFAYEGGAPLFRNVGFHIKQGEIVALIGPNGVGKSTLLRTLIGDLDPTGGSIRWGANVERGYYDQEQANLNGGNTVLEEVWSAYPHLEEVRIRTVLGNFLFSGEDVLKPVSALSGGEKARVSLAKLMLQRANVLILDEPTNHLDLFSKEVLESALMDYEGTVLFISHDRYFLNKLADRIVELSSDGAAYFLGNYDDYLEKKRELVERQAERQASVKSPAGNVASSPVTEYEAAKQAKREERSRQRRLEQTEQAIAAKEETVAALEQELLAPEVYQDYVKVQEIHEKIERLRNELQDHYSEWESLME